jgi:Family of unknown function (DUF6065)
MRADKAALGTIPTNGYRHCEPLRTASSFGWYIFAPMDIHLKWNGADIFYLNGDSWEILTDAQLPHMQQYWDKHCPEEMQGMCPPYLAALPMRGIVQIWSGLLVSTHKDWSIHVRPLANIPQSHLYASYEGIIETDEFSPCPLFTNIQLLATDTVITLQRIQPLFQVQPLMRQTYSDEAHKYQDINGFNVQGDNGNLVPMPTDLWKGLRRTLRVDTPETPLESGRYTIAARKRQKHEND